MSNTSLKTSLENAEASINMEGLHISKFCKELCIKLMNKEITFDEYIKIVTAGVESHGV